jgi:hypothetical protein
MASLDQALRASLVAEAVCKVDRSEVRYIDNPYLTAPTVTVQALTGTYSVDTVTTSDAGLTVSDEFIASAHIFDFESALSAFNIWADRIDDMTAAVAIKIDKWVNLLLPTLNFL